MAVLDCESYDSALRSIRDIYGVSDPVVAEYLQYVGLEEEYERNRISQDCDDHLKSIFEAEFGPPTEPLESVCWFHLTRVPKGTSFREGILPLGMALDKVWQTIAASIPTKKRRNLEKMRRSGVRDFQYTLKVGDKLHWGPYAMLVRESAFQASALGKHDYLDLPEIVEDICNEYLAEFCEDIREEVSAALTRCIVKFESRNANSYELVAPAFLYCWCETNSQEFNPLANTCYSASGEAVAFKAIRKVDFLD